MNSDGELGFVFINRYSPFIQIFIAVLDILQSDLGGVVLDIFFSDGIANNQCVAVGVISITTCSRMFVGK